MAAVRDRGGRGFDMIAVFRVYWTSLESTDAVYIGEYASVTEAKAAIVAARKDILAAVSLASDGDFVDVGVWQITAASQGSQRA